MIRYARSIVLAALFAIPFAAVAAPPPMAPPVSALAVLQTGEIREGQMLLRALGHDPGPIDGKIGPSVRRAVSGFQRNNALAPTGQLDEWTLQALRDAVRTRGATPGVIPGVTGGAAAPPAIAPGYRTAPPSALSDEITIGGIPNAALPDDPSGFASLRVPVGPGLSVAPPAAPLRTPASVPPPAMQAPPPLMPAAPAPAPFAAPSLRAAPLAPAPIAPAPIAPAPMASAPMASAPLAPAVGAPPPPIAPPAAAPFALNAPPAPALGSPPPMAPAPPQQMQPAPQLAPPAMQPAVPPPVFAPLAPTFATPTTPAPAVGAQAMPFAQPMDNPAPVNGNLPGSGTSFSRPGGGLLASTAPAAIAAGNGLIGQTWLIRDENGAEMTLTFRSDGRISGPAFADSLRWEQRDGALFLYFETPLGGKVVRRGGADGAGGMRGIGESARGMSLGQPPKRFSWNAQLLR